MSNPILSDQEDRDRIVHDLDVNLFVDAGAGSGKTKAMVDRICSLVDRGEAITSIVAITFTEKAAAELRDRLRNRITEQLHGGEGDPELGPLRAEALNKLDSAPIGTIHSFAGRLLRENPIEAGVPPLLTISDELASQIAFQRRWDTIVSYLDTDENARAALEALLALGVTLEHLELITHKLDGSWDRLTPGAALPTLPALDTDSVLREIKDLVSLASQCQKPDGDTTVGQLIQLGLWVEQFERIISEVQKNELLPTEIFKSLATLTLPRTNFGSKANWGEANLERLRAQRDIAAETVIAAITSQLNVSIQLLIAVLSEFILAAAQERQESGELEFSDLLVLSCRLLTEDELVWQRMSQRYRFIMLDEFQDTDPLQAELAVRLASTHWIGTGRWDDSMIRPGALFTVGDPKQSIYRFRRADIATFLDMGTRFDNPVTLSTNFRSSAPVLEWINTVFGVMISADGHRQPSFGPLAPRSDRPPWDDTFGHAISVIGQGQIAGSAEDARIAESHDIARLIRDATGMTEGVPVWTHQELRKGEWVEESLALSDVTVLLPSRTALPALQDALDAAGIEYIAEASSLVYSSDEIRDLLLVAQAVANTADEAALVVALRSPIFGCGDDELLEWSADLGKWNIFGRDVREDSASKVSRSLAYLKELAQELPTLTPAELLERIVVDRQLLEMQLDKPIRAREIWRRIRYIVDQAEAWHENTHGSLRDYLAWAHIQQEDDARVKEAVVPEIGINAVRIMTIHASKGLEFPMVIVAGASSAGGGNRGPDLLWSEDGQLELQFLKKDKLAGRYAIATHGYGLAAENEKAFLDAEKVRLLYVACTRAQTHLVVSVHQYESIGSSTKFPAFASQLLESGVVLKGSVLYSGPTSEISSEKVESFIAPVLDTSDDEWELQREQWSANSAQPASFSITSLAKHPEEAPLSNPFVGPGSLVFSPATPAQVESESEDQGERPRVRFVEEDEEESDYEETSESSDAAEEEQFEAGHTVGASSRSSMGARIGTAVHRTLELSRLVMDEEYEDFEALAKTAALGAEVADWKHVASLAKSALETKTIKHAAQLTHWLELPMAKALGKIVLEGVADLVYMEDNGDFVIVDFKTDRTLTQETLDGYWAQLSAYANMIHQASQVRVSKLVLLQISKSPAVTYEALLLTH
jgi:ATP-dependent helicase/nuclease subunit A